MVCVAGRMSGSVGARGSLTGRCWCVLVVLLTSPTVTYGGVTRCNGDVENLPVTTEATGILYSPNYPDNYPNSDECGWLMTTGEDSLIVQLHMTEIQLEIAEDDECHDYLAAYDGNSTSAPLLKQWCGTDKVIVRSSGSSLFLQFVSNDRVNGKGFVLRYFASAPYSSECVEGEVTQVAVGPSPVLLQVSRLYQTRSCKWRLSADEGDRLILKVLHLSGALPCSDGYLAFHDGGEPTAVEMVRWCGSSTPPFSSLYTSDREVLVWTHIPVFSPVTVDMWIQVQRDSVTGSCEEDRPTMLEVIEGPLYFPLPLYTPPRGSNKTTDCGSVRVNSKTNGTEWKRGLRVDVIALQGRQATCDDNDSPALSVLSASGEQVNADCWRETRPVYWARETVNLSPTDNTTSFVRVQPTTFPCTGEIVDGFYTASNTLTHTINDLGYPRFTQCQLLVKAREEGDHAAALINTDVIAETGCEDVLTVYSGNSTEGEVLLKHCGSEEKLINRKLVSPSNAMLIVFSTDDDNNYGDGVNIKYYSVPDSDACETRKELFATTEPRMLQSPNFPNYYPLNYDCFYNIATNITGHVVHLELMSNDFASDDDFLQFFDYDDDDTGGGLFKISSGDQLRSFTSVNSDILVRFYSDDTLNNGGWQLRYRSVPQTDYSSEMTFNLLTIIITCAMGGVIIILLLIVALTCCCKGRTANPPVQL